MANFTAFAWILILLAAALNAWIFSVDQVRRLAKAAYALVVAFGCCIIVELVLAGMEGRPSLLYSAGLSLGWAFWIGAGAKTPTRYWAGLFTELAATSIFAFRALNGSL